MQRPSPFYRQPHMLNILRIGSMLQISLCSLYAFVGLYAGLINTNVVSEPNGLPFTYPPSLRALQHYSTCVNVTEHPTWGAQSGLFVVEDCVAATVELLNKVWDKQTTRYDFYSKMLLPTAEVANGWPLPEKAESGEPRSVILKYI